MRGTEEKDFKGGPMYFFQRKDLEPFDSLYQCRENPDESCGLVKSPFRSSNDATLLTYKSQKCFLKHGILSNSQYAEENFKL
jgi:meiotically up-regulated gene 157 (Mug157) protein